MPSENYSLKLVAFSIVDIASFKYFGVERTWWKLFQKCDVRTISALLFVLEEKLFAL